MTGHEEDGSANHDVEFILFVFIMIVLLVFVYQLIAYNYIKYVTTERKTSTGLRSSKRILGFCEIFTEINR